MGATLNTGSFQFTMEEAKTQQIEKPKPEPGQENPQISSMIVRAMKGNTGVIFIGGPGVTNATGFELAAGDAVSVDIQGGGNVYAYGTKAGDKLCVLWTGP